MSNENKNNMLKNEIEFIYEKKNIISEINNFFKLTEKQKLKSSIKTELKKKNKMFKHDKKYYRDLIFFSKSNNILDEIDLELVFLFPWAVSSSATKIEGLFGMLIFFAIIMLGFVYELRAGALTWKKEN
jgi:hypothetical protein